MPKDILKLGALLPDHYRGGPKADTGAEEPKCLVGKAPVATRGCFVWGGTTGGGSCGLGTCTAG